MRVGELMKRSEKIKLRVHKNVNSTMNLIDKLDINNIPDPSCLWRFYLPVEGKKLTGRKSAR